MKYFTRVLAVVLAVTLAFSAVVFAQLGKNETRLFSFESGTTEGWQGTGKWEKSCSAVTHEKAATHGSKALKVDVTGSTDWNQDIAKFSGPFDSKWKKLVALSFDIYVPEASAEGMSYQELYLVVQGQAQSWYQLKQPLNAGMNKVTFKLNNAYMDTDLWHIMLIVNNSEPWRGPIYIDNIVGKMMGEPGTLKGKAVDKKTGKGIPDALIVVGEKLEKTDNSGNFKMTIPEDSYKMEIVKYGYRLKTMSDVKVPAKRTNDLGVIEVSQGRPPRTKDTTVNVDASKVLRKIDPHKMYGQNLAVWHPVDGYRNNRAIELIKDLNATFIRIPGGDYGNEWDWKTGDVYDHEGNVRWTPELNYYGGIVPFIKRLDREMDGKVEVLPIINIMSPMQKSIDERVDYAIEWIKDMKEKGFKIRYVEVGNEPDSKGKVPGPAAALKKGATLKEKMMSPGSSKVKQWWSRIDNYTDAYMWASYKLKRAFPGIKVMGPCPMQPMNREEPGGEPWLAQNDTNSPYWVQRFLKRAGKYVDAVAVHEYPFWANNNAVALLKMPQTTWPVYMPKYRRWIKEGVNDLGGKYANKYIEMALTEWNSGDENVMTAKLENALFCADYMGSFIKQGMDMAFIWDLYTQKPGLGGGHGLIDAENDP
ncbi:MAG: hypothetical protein ACOC4H_01595, partial [bacterium]